MYYLHTSMEDLEHCDRLELDWIYKWLISQKKSEQDQMEKSVSG